MTCYAVKTSVAPWRFKNSKKRAQIQPVVHQPYAMLAVFGEAADNKPVQAPLYNFNEFSSMIGFQEVWDFEKKYASLEAD